ARIGLIRARSGRPAGGGGRRSTAPRGRGGLLHGIRGLVRRFLRALLRLRSGIRRSRGLLAGRRLGLVLLVILGGFGLRTIRKIALIVLIRFEIRLVPAAALQPEYR